MLIEADCKDVRIGPEPRFPLAFVEGRICFDLHSRGKAKRKVLVVMHIGMSARTKKFHQSTTVGRYGVQASFRLFTSLDLASCTAVSVTVSLSDIAGSFGEMLLGLQPDLEAAMASELSRQIVAECRMITALP